MRTARIAGLVLFLSVAIPLAVFPQTYPAKPIRLIVPNAPGGGLDQMARLVAQKTSEALGQPVVVENRAGANSIIGTELVAHAAPDGYTLLVGNATSHVANVYLLKSIPYDPVTDFTPITGALQSITCVAVNPLIGVNTLKELIDYARRNPGKLSYGSSGASGAYHLSGEVFKSVTGTDIVHIPYKGLAPAMTGLLAGEIAVAFTSLTVAVPQARAGKIRILAVMEGKRYPGLPEVPVVSESVPGFRAATIWNGFFGPAGLPQAVVARLNTEILKALNAPEVRSKLEAAEVIGGTPEQFGAYVKSEIENFGRIVKAVGIQPE